MVLNLNASQGVAAKFVEEIIRTDGSMELVN